MANGLKDSISENTSMRTQVCFAFPLLLLLALIPSTFAVSGCSDGFYCRAYADKPFFGPGDTGKLTIDLKNLNSYTVRVNNISINFPWAAYINGQWDGNSTIYLNTNVNSQ